MRPTRPIPWAVLFTALCWLWAPGAARAQGLVLTLAGGGPTGFCGDGTRAAASCLRTPTGIAYDADGNRYIADSLNHRVRRVTPGGIISTIAGNGTAGFSGDGGPAVMASLREPSSVAYDFNNNVLYVLDSGNNRLRRITSNGIITTIAGDGTAGFSGDRGPATAARIFTENRPAAIAWTPTALYITDTGNERIRRIDSAGIIATIAGNGTPGFSGDGGLATAAMISRPSGPVALDFAGNIYIADLNNARVRRISTAGIISTFAGNGTAGLSGDGGPATSASLNEPAAVAADRLGNLFIADRGNNRIRKVAANGVISTLAGGGAQAGADGAVSTDVQLRAPQGIAADRHALLVCDTLDNRVLQIVGAYARPGAVRVNPTSLEFRFKVGGELPDPDALLLFSPDLIEFGYVARISTVGGPWLGVRPFIGFTPGSFRVGALPIGLRAGTYQGTITFTVPQATNSPVTVPVTLTVTDEPPALAVKPSQLTFSTVQGSNPPGQALHIVNEGGGTLLWAAGVAPTSGLRAPDWLSLSDNAGTGTTHLRVAVNSASLAPGYYQAQIVVRAAGGDTRRTPVTLQVTSAAATLHISQTGLSFTAVEGSATLPARNLNVLNTGSGTMNWTTDIRSSSGGNWLSLAPTAGASIGGQPPPQIAFTANATGLRAGAYHAVVRIAATGAANSPQFVNAVLQILPPGTTPPPQPSPSGLLFMANTGGAAPAAQQVRVYAGGSTAVSFNASTTEVDDDDWLDVDPAGGTASATTPGDLRVAVDPSGLGPGTYRGFVNIALSDGSTRSVNVLLVVAPAGTFAAPAGTFAASGGTLAAPAGTFAASGGTLAAPAGTFAAPGDGGQASPPEGSQAGMPAPLASAACTPARLAVVHTGLVSNFSSPVGWPVALVVRVSDDCGNSQTSAAVVTSFSNGDATLSMANLRNGQYSATWTPATSASRVTITSTAVASGLQQGSAQISGGLGANSVPLVFRGGAVHAASFAQGAPLSPGSIFSVFGSNLASQQSFAQTVPLPRELGGLSATLGNSDVPLFFSSAGQVNAQIPFDLPANSTAQLVVKVGSSFTVPETINVAVAQPGIFTVNQSGSGPGAILDARFALVSATNPVRPGDVIQIFATGLGATNPAVSSGERSPSSPPATLVRPVTAAVDGMSAPVQFGGLAPGFVGLYQVNVQIPAGVRSGEVNLVLTQDGVDSNTVTVFVQQ